METALPEFHLPDSDVRKYQIAVESSEEINFVLEDEPPPVETYAPTNSTITVLPKTSGLIPVIHVVSPGMIPINIKQISSKNIFYQQQNQQMGSLTESKMISNDNLLYPNVMASDSSLQDISVHPSSILTMNMKPSTTVLCPTVLSMTTSMSDMVQIPQSTSLPLLEAEEQNLHVENVELISPTNDQPETIPMETIPVETISMETMPVEPIPMEPLPMETMPEETMPEENMPVEKMPVETISEENPTVNKNIKSNEPTKQTKVLKTIFLKPSPKPSDGNKLIILNL